MSDYFDEPSDGIEWDNTPDLTRPKHIPIWGPRHLSPVKALVLSEQLIGVYTHFIDGKTQPCRGSVKACSGCAHGLSRRWKGYLACTIPANGRQVLVEVTTEAARSCPILLKPKCTLRGGVIELRRCGEAKNAPVRAWFSSGNPSQDLPEAFDVRAQLCLIWGIGIVGNDRPQAASDLFTG